MSADHISDYITSYMATQVDTPSVPSDINAKLMQDAKKRKLEEVKEVAGAVVAQAAVEADGLVGGSESEPCGCTFTPPYPPRGAVVY